MNLQSSAETFFTFMMEDNFGWNQTLVDSTTSLTMITEQDQTVNVTFEGISLLTNVQKEKLYVENYHVGIKSAFAVAALLSVCCSVIAIVALRRTRRIPENAKFLSTALLFFDSMFVSLSTIRKFVLDPLYNTAIQTFSTSFMQLGYVTVGMMAFERFCVFYRPMTYIRIATGRRVRIITIVIWLAVVSTFQTTRYGICYMKFRSFNVFMQAGLCNQIVTVYYAGLVLVVLVTSMVCYCEIFMIVKQKSNSTSRPISFNLTIDAIRSFRTTSLVLVYIFVILVTSLAYGMIILFIRWKNIDPTALRICLEITTMMNCIFDPFLYVLWFKECQMEVLKFLAPFSSRLQSKVDRMKLNIFNIVVSPTRPISFTQDTSESFQETCSVDQLLEKL